MPREKEALYGAVAEMPELLHALQKGEDECAVKKLLERCPAGMYVVPACWSAACAAHCTCPYFQAEAPLAPGPHKYAHHWCKHVALVLYKIAQQCDVDEFSIFRARGIDFNNVVGHVDESDSSEPDWPTTSRAPNGKKRARTTPHEDYAGNSESQPVDLIDSSATEDEEVKAEVKAEPAAVVD